MATDKKFFNRKYFENDTNVYDENTSFYNEVNWDVIADSMINMYYMLTGKKLRTFLDIGCAKGYLVRSLRRKGVKAFGIDISAWAIQNATPEIKKYVSQCSVLDYRFEMPFDMVSAYSTLHYLSPQELEKFITRKLKMADINIFHVADFPLGNKPDMKKHWLKLDPGTKVFKPLEWWLTNLTRSKYELKYIDWDYTDRVTTKRGQEVDLYLQRRKNDTIYPTLNQM